MAAVDIGPGRQKAFLEGKAGRLVVTFLLLIAAFLLATYNISTPEYRRLLSKFDVAVIGWISLTTLAGYALASLRLQLIASDLGYHLTFRQSVAAVSIGLVGGSLFFQLIGQIVARGSYLARLSIPMAGTVLITGNERIGAAFVSLGLACAGALYLFHGITVDSTIAPVRMFVGLLTVLAVCGYMWRMPIGLFARTITLETVKRAIRSLSISTLVQLITLVSYVIAAHAIAPDVSVLNLAAASTLVMFAASIPISFAGWGVRELSAVAALSAAGVPKEGALLVAILIGAISIIVAFTIAAASAGAPVARKTDIAHARRTGTSSHEVGISRILPVLSAALIFFQVNLPTETSIINVNLADPVLIVGGLIVLFAIMQGRPPSWRLPGMNLHLIACTLAITLALLIGAYSIGWTTWALANKYAGWFVLMSAVATGWMSHHVGLKRFVRTFAVVGVTVVAFQLAANALQIFGVIQTGAVVGFTQNQNAFAFQCLMVLCAAMALPNQRSLLMSFAMAGLWLSLSRAGVLAGIIVLICGAIYIRGILLSIAGAAALAGMIVLCLSALSYLLVGTCTSGIGNCARLAMINDSSVSDHLSIASGALQMFLDHPIFGAGLGVYINQFDPSKAFVIHSTPLWLLAEFGVVGTAAFLIPVVRILWAEAWRFRANDMAGNLALLLIVALAAMSLTHELLYQRTFWFLLGAAMGHGFVRAAPFGIGAPPALSVGGYDDGRTLACTASGPSNLCASHEEIVAGMNPTSPYSA
ncbi:hypothetical protein BH10PSE10_BH10PSE10_15670 [soil metagenome]